MPPLIKKYVKPTASVILLFKNMPTPWILWFCSVKSFFPEEKLEGSSNPVSLLVAQTWRLETPSWFTAAVVPPRRWVGAIKALLTPFCSVVIGTAHSYFKGWFRKPPSRLQSCFQGSACQLSSAHAKAVGYAAPCGCDSVFSVSVHWPCPGRGNRLQSWPGWGLRWAGSLWEWGGYPKGRHWAATHPQWIQQEGVAMLIWKSEEWKRNWSCQRAWAQ